MKRCIFQLMLITLISAPSLTTAEDLFRWVDENGVVSFGSRPPADANAEPINREDLRIPPNTNQDNSSTQGSGEIREVSDTNGRPSDFDRFKTLPLDTVTDG